MELLLQGFIGGLATYAADLCYFPIDTIKTRQMASNSKINYQKSAEQLGKFRGVIAKYYYHLFFKVQTQVLISIPQGFVFFTTYEGFKKKLIQFNSNYLVINHLIAAALAEITAVLVKNPFEVLKNQLQVGLDKNIISTIISIHKQQGIKGFYQGLSAIILRDISYVMINFAIYEHLKDLYKKQQQTEFISLAGAGGCGFIAGAIASFLTNPFDVVKVKLMTSRKKQYNGQMDCFRQIYSDQGFYGLFRSVHLRVFGVASTSIVYFAVYEQLNQFFNKKSQNSE